MAGADSGSTNSQDELLAVLDTVRAEFGDRELHQFIVACCRRIWHLITDPRSRAAVEVAERYHAGLADIEEVDSARQQAWDAESEALARGEPITCGGMKAAPARAAVYAVYTEPPENESNRFGYAADDAARALRCAAEAAANATCIADSRLFWEGQWDAEFDKEREVQRRLFRERFGSLNLELP